MDQPILVGYEGREQGLDALRLGITLAEILDTGLVLGAAFPEIRRTGGYRAYEEALARESEPLLREASSIARAMAPGLSVETRALGMRQPGDALCELARDEGARLVVLGSTHRGPVGRVFPGGTAVRMLAHPPCSLAIAPSGYAETAPGPLRLIGVAFDGSWEARSALAAGIALAQRACTGIRVFSVAESFRASQVPGPAPYTPPIASRFDREAVDRALNSALEALPPEIGGQRIALEGDPARALAATGPRAVDLMVVGCRGFGRARRLLAHSVSAALTATPPWPVVVVPSRAPADWAPAAAETAEPAAAPHG